TIQPRVALRAPPASDAGGGTGAGNLPEGRVSGPRLEIEPPNGSRIEDLDGGAISLSPTRTRPARLPSTRCRRNRGRYSEEEPHTSTPDASGMSIESFTRAIGS